MCWEADYHEHVSFITLTFDPAFEPVDHSVRKADFQLFMKRLRKASSKKLLYFACGEYGEQFGRPHYHAVVFGLGFSEEDEKLVSDAWQGRGFVAVSPFERGRALYVASYLLKEVDSRIDLRGRSRPFALMSKRIGLRYCEDNAERILNGVELRMLDGTIVPIPRYFRKVLDMPEEVSPDYVVDSFLLHSLRVGEGDLMRRRVTQSMHESRKAAFAELAGKLSRKEGNSYGL